MPSARRQFLRALGLLTVGSVAGCSGESETSTESPPADGADPSPTDRETVVPETTLTPEPTPTPTPPMPTPLPTESTPTPSDPAGENATKLAAASGDEEDRLGASVALSGDGSVALLGAPQDEDPNGERAGAVYAFARDGDSWTQQARLAADDGDRYDDFGQSIALSSDGSTAVINSREAGVDESSRGSLYVFERQGDAWSQRVNLTAADGDSRDILGQSVSVSADGRTALAGARNDEDPNGGASGSAYVFGVVEGAWTQRAKLAAEDGDSEDQFGTSVALSDDGTTAVVGARWDEPSGARRSGSVYVFDADGDSWTQTAKLTAEDGDSEDKFGTSVAVSGDGSRVVVGAREDEDPNGEYAGSAYVFGRDGGAWSQRAKVVPDDGDSGDSFGRAVALTPDGTTAVVGASGDEAGNGPYAGSAYVFGRDGGSWTRRQKLVPADGDDDDNFGVAVDVADGAATALVGANFDEDPNGMDAGSGYVFDL